MKNLLRCHLNYLISKTTIIVSALVLFIIVLASISSSLALDNSTGYIDNNYIYFYNTFFITKIILVIYAVFIFGYSFTSKSDQYVIIFIASGISRSRIIITKLLALAIVVLGICYFAYFEYMLIGFILFKQFIFSIKYLLAYLALYLLLCYFGLMSVLLIQIFDNIYTIIIPFALMNFGEIINEDNNLLVDIFNILIPNYSNKLVFHFGGFHAIILCLILLVINIYIYQIKDIK